MPTQPQPSTATSTGKRVSTDEALSILIADHRTVAELFQQYQSATSSNQDGLCRKICHELEIHSLLEEELFYPAVAARSSAKSLVPEARSEHDTVKELIGKVRSCNPGDPQIPKLMTQLRDHVEHHVTEEENQMFPKVEKEMAGELPELGREMQRRRLELGAPPQVKGAQVKSGGKQ